MTNVDWHAKLRGYGRACNLIENNEKRSRKFLDDDLSRISSLSVLVFTYTVAHKTIPMFGGFEQMDLVQSDVIIYGFGTYVQETTSS